jgi:hypothetical protein
MIACRGGRAFAVLPGGYDASPRCGRGLKNAGEGGACNGWMRRSGIEATMSNSVLKRKAKKIEVKEAA